MEAERVFRQYGGMMLRHAQLMMGRDALAEDAVQEALVRFIRLEPSFQDERHEKAWLLTVTGNICRDMLRRIRIRRETDVPEWFDVPSAAGTPDEVLTRKEQQVRLAQAVMALPVKYREPVLLVYYHEMTGSEAAQVMGMTATAFRSRLMRARDMLKVQLSGEVEL